MIKGRESSLDALRGFAAVAVVIAHTTIVGLYNVEPYWTYLKWSPLRVFWSGHQAVILFFVLSGFALSRMLESIKGESYFSYLSSRIVRLYPPYLASVIVAALAYWLLLKLGFNWEKGWLNLSKPVLDQEVLINHLLMIGSFDTNSINPPIWSLVHEMRLSIVFPLILAATVRWGWKALMVAVSSSLFIGALTLHGKPDGLSWWHLSLLSTVHYGTFFLLGAFLSRKSPLIVKYLVGLSNKARGVLWLSYLLLYAYPFDNPWTFGQRIFGDIFIGIGSAGLIGLALSSNTVFLSKYGQSLGKISYSLYLNHNLALSLSIIIFYMAIPEMGVWLVTFCLAFLLAYLMGHLVEQPAQKLSRVIRNISFFSINHSS
jgi:peptidoglycan/LPS O-acetylase OafA/YrhL